MPTVSLGAVLWLAPAAARAQEAVPYDTAVEVQLFEPALGPHSFLTVSGAEVAPDKLFGVNMMLTYLSRPFTVYNVDPLTGEIEDDRSLVVEHLFGGQLAGWYGLKDRFQIGAALPMVFTMTGDGLSPGTAEPESDGLQVSGLGDLRLEGTYRFLQRAGLLASGTVGATVPSSRLAMGDKAWLGDALPSGRVRLAAEWSNPAGTLTVGGNLGAILRKERELYSSVIGPQATYGLAAAFRLMPALEVIGEVFGRKGLSFDVDENPLEADGALRLRATRSVTVLAGAGAGIVGGIGSPEFRVFAAATWAPDVRDSDADGVPNLRDRCPFQAEDRDGWRDDDGCVDEDNDGDMIADAGDACPGDAEDRDGFEDEDGCPEADNDKDGILDADDQCPEYAEDKAPPNVSDGCPASRKDSDDDSISDAQDKCIDEPEDMDGFQDEDGCPDVDNDGDGVPDEYDGCSTAAEDVDGFEDENGCPEADNDGDGFLDGEDGCPLDREVVNGVKDFDGCPDTGGRVLARLDGDRVVLTEKIKFRHERLVTAAREVLDQAAVVMRGSAGAKKWRVVAVADKERTEAKSRAASQARADAIKAHLVSRGVPAAAIEAIGAVSDTPMVAIVCTEREQPDGAAPPSEEAPR